MQRTPVPARTLFVRSLPDSASNQRLEEIFSEIGPIKQCFVVREKGTETCRGFGYVTYSMAEDAQRALKEVKEYDGRRLSVSVAKKKIREKRKPRPAAAPDEPAVAPEGPAAAPKGPAAAPKGPAAAPKGPAAAPKGPAVAPKGPAAAPKGPAAAPKGPAAAPKGPAAAPKGPAAAHKGPAAAPKGPAAALKGPAAAPKEPAPAPKQNEQKPKGFKKILLKARLIIRNLSFKCSEDDLKQVCSKFGTVLEAKIPLKPDGKMRGFAFVLFKNVSEAGRALNALNMKEIKGRQVAIDWAVPKDKFIATQASSSAANKIPEAAAKQSGTTSDAEDEDEEKPQAAPQKKKVSSKPSKQQVEESPSEDEDDSEEQHSEEEEDDDDDDDNDEEEDDAKDDDDVSQEEEDSDDDMSNLDSNDDEDEEEDEDEDSEDEESAKKKTPKKLLPSDVKEGRTIFIRNLSFDTEEEGLEEVLLKYGELNYIKVVIHADTGHSKGCAFAQFKSKEDADKCMAAAQDEAENGGIRVDGRKLLIVAAVSREDASKLKVDKVKVETGTRNLFLAREGLIRAGTKAAEGVPEADMVKRTRFEEVKRTKLKSQNVFVSKTRLCVHNLPKSVDNKKLKALCLQAVKGSKGVRVTECRVMYDKKPERGQAMGHSLGYGFVQFEAHEHALSTLRYLNNNPDIFGSHKRPIVEFSLEDIRKLKIKELREQKNKERNQPFKRGAKPQSQTAGEGKGPRKDGNKAQSSSVQTQNERGPPQSQKQGRQYLGFQSKPEVEHVDLQNGKKRRKVLPFPSHRGPKIRMRDKGKQQAPPPKKARPGLNRKDRQRQKMEKPMQPNTQKVKTTKKQFKRRDGDRFDSLVEQYKKKLMGNINKNTNVKRSKWFDS